MSRKVVFIKSGVPYRFGYLAGHEAELDDKQAAALIKSGIVVNKADYNPDEDKKAKKAESK